MKTDFQSAYGKSLGEVVRDITDFLSTPYIINEEKHIDLCSLIDELNMHEQFSFALLSEAEAQGWSPDAAEGFYRRAVADVMDGARVDAMLAAFGNKEGDAYRSYEKRYGNRFFAPDGSYWSTALALGMDANRVGDVLEYLRRFIVVLMEFAYMEERNPEFTYTWCYCESFEKMLADLTAEPEPAPQPLKIRALGGTVGKRDADGYTLSLGLDVENPNPTRMARSVQLDITLKDKEGRVITVIGDKLQSLDPGAIYHYGITRKIKGAAVASFAATAKASAYLKLSTPIMKHAKLLEPRVTRSSQGMKLSAKLKGEYDRPLSSVLLHYQFLSNENRILGGGNEWLMNGMCPNDEQSVISAINVPITGVAKVIYSIDFDVMELISE